MEGEEHFELMSKKLRHNMDEQFNAKGYIAKDKWSETNLIDDVSEAKLCKFLNDSSCDDDVKILEEKFITQDNGQFTYGSVSIKNKSGSIGLVQFVVKVKNIDCDVIDAFIISELNLIVGGSNVISTHMIINLIFAQLLGYEIKEEMDGEITLPIVAISLAGNRFNLSALSHHQIDLELFLQKRCLGISLDRCKIYIKPEVSAEHMEENKVVSTQHKYCFSSGQILPFNYICNYIIFTPNTNFRESCFDSSQKIYPEIESVCISRTNKNYTIKFDNNLGEITKFDIMGKIFYGLPLSPQLKNKKGLKTFLENKSTEHIHGINFSRMDDIRLYINTSASSDNYEYNVWALGYNIFRTHRGMGGLAYA